MRNLFEPKTWKSLEDCLWRKSLDRRISRIRPYIAFRGVQEPHNDLKTGLQRLRLLPRSTTLRRQKLERRIVDAFGTYAREYLPHAFSDWDVLLLGQHHGLPTRLLDWTMSPYVALFFATADPNKDKKDGFIWCVRRQETNKALPENLTRALQDESGEVFTVKNLKEKFCSLREFDKCRPPALLWFEPPSVSPRIVNQYALFSVMPGVASRQDNWLRKHPKWYWCIRVRADLKQNVREHLQVMNINERIIYPGLEGIARWIRSGYNGWKDT